MGTDVVTDLVIWGASGHARVVADAARLQGHRIAGFLDDSFERRGQPFAGAEVIGGGDNLEELRASGLKYLHVAIGNCSARYRLAEIAKTHGFELVTITHPRATVAADVKIGSGSFLAAGSIVNPAAKIGSLVVLNTGCSVDHDCIVGDGAHIGPGVHVGGAVEIGRLAWIGIGASLRDRVRVGENSIIGAGAVVVSNVASQVIAFGVPARAIRARKPNE